MAIITGKIFKVTGAARVAVVTFESLSTPLSASPSLITSGTESAQTDADGNFSIVLREGDYTVKTAGADPVTITVPAGEDSYDFLTLITEEIAYNPDTVGNFALLKGNNLSDLADAEAARLNLSVYSRAYIDGLATSLLGPTQTVAASVIDRALGPTHIKTLTANTIFTIQNLQDGEQVTIKTINTAGNSFTATFTGVNWPNNNTAPVQSTNGKYDVITIVNVQGVYSGSYVQGFVL